MAVKMMPFCVPLARMVVGSPAACTKREIFSTRPAGAAVKIRRVASIIFDLASSEGSKDLIASRVAEGVWKLSASWTACRFQSSNLRGRRCFAEDDDMATQKDNR